MQRGQLSWILSFTQSHNSAASLDAPVSPAVFACDANGERGGEMSRVPLRLQVWESVCIVPPLVASQYFLSENKDCVQAGILTPETAASSLASGYIRVQTLLLGSVDESIKHYIKSGLNAPSIPIDEERCNPSSGETKKKYTESVNVFSAVGLGFPSLYSWSS